jgi:acyl-CoA synthetase (AMP-forming)/AMP-acid ligase II
MKVMSANTTTGRRVIAGRSVRWDQTRAEAAYATGWWVRETLRDALDRAARDTPERVLIQQDDRQLTCIGLLYEARAVAHALLSRFPSGSVISVMLPNWIEAAPIYLGATLSGMVVHPLLPSLRDRDLQFTLSDAQSRLIFVPGHFRNQNYAAMLSRVNAQLERPPEVVVIRGGVGTASTYESLISSGGQRELPSLDPDAVQLVLYTSGTTGTPKGILHSQNTIRALMRQLAEHWRINSGDTFLVPSPISHIGGSIYAFEAPLLLGSRAVLMERWDAVEAIRLVDSQCCTHMAGATPFLEQLLAAAKRANTRLPSLKVFICGGASVPPTLIRQSLEHFENAAVTRVYGSTEVPVITVGVVDRADPRHAAETDGRAGIAEVRLVGNDGDDVPEGEIRARGPQMLLGYLHAEDEEAVFDSAGYYRTGDLGRWIDGDYLTVCGRLKDIIIRNGENISPKEIEDLLINHPNILAVTIVAVPDSRTGERACAVVVPRTHPGPGVDSIAGFLQDQGVAPFKFPEQVEIWESLPKNDTGKVLKHVVSSELQRQTQHTK